MESINKVSVILDELAEDCSVNLREGLENIRNEYVPDFLERVIHAFFIVRLIEILKVDASVG